MDAPISWLRAGVYSSLAALSLVVACPAIAQTEIAELLQRHAELTARLDELDASVRARVRRDLLDQIENWRLGIDDFDAAEFRQRLQIALETAQSYGMDIARLERMYETSRAIILRSDLSTQALVAPSGPIERLSQFLDWAGIEEARLAEAAAEGQQARVELYRRVSLAYIEALLEPDPGVAVARFRAYADAIRTLASAEADALASEADALATDLQLVEDIVWGVPLLGDAMDIVALVEGRTPITGQTLEGLDWALTLLGVAIGPIDQLIKRVPLAQQAIDNAVAIAREMAEPLVATGRYTREQLAALVNRFGRADDALFAARDQSRRELVVLSDQAIFRFDQSPEGAEAARVWAQANLFGALKVKASERVFAGFMAGVDNAEDLRRLVERNMNAPVPDPQWLAVTQAYIGLRQDKRAIGALKDADPALRDMVFDFEQALFGTVQQSGGAAINLGDGLVDRQTIAAMDRRLQMAFTDNPLAREADLAGAQQIESWIRRHASQNGDGAFQLDSYIDPDNLQFEVFNATNTPPSRGDIGADRDITYKLILNDGTRIDVPADFVEPHYQASLYTTLRGQTPANMEEVTSFTQAMDHAVTDGYVLEAYRPGMDVGEFLGSPGIRVGASAAEDLASTIAYKGHEWFERGHHAFGAGDALRGWDHMAEGMRQLTKQYDNQIMPRLNAQGLNEIANVPPLLGQAVDLMKRVTYPDSKLPFGASRLNPAQAEAAIRDMGFASLDDVASQLGLYFESLVKSAPGGGL